MKKIEISKRGAAWHAHCLKTGHHLGEITLAEARELWDGSGAVFVREAMQEMAALTAAEPNDQHPQREAVVSLLLALQAAGFEPKSVNDGDGVWQDTPTIATAADAITAVDEANVSFADPAGGRSHVAFIVLGNADWEIVNDYTAGERETSQLFDRTIMAWATDQEERATR